MLYLDHAATTPMRPEVWAAMEPFAGALFGNASGSHATARLAKNALEEARERVAALLGVHPMEIVFTGGGTEADNLALQGPALVGGGRRGVVVSAVEHEAVMETAQFLASLGCHRSIVEVDGAGRVSPEAIAEAVTPETAVVSVMTANNETGVEQPIPEIVAAAKESNPQVIVHSDAVQSFISTPITVDKLGIDLLSLAAHKFGGPKGVGLLYVKKGIPLVPVLHGGGQELGRRSGTHNVMGAVGMAVAMERTVADRDRFRCDVAEARRRFETRLGEEVPGFKVTVTHGRLVQHSHVRFEGVRNETLLVRLDQVGLSAAAGSSCQSGATTVSHVLSAMGIPAEQARQCLRFSFGWTTTPQDGDFAAELVVRALP